MADARTYIRVHDGMDEHPKIEPLSDGAFRLLHKCWAYCSRQLTDGRLTDAAWQNRGTAKSRRELVDAGLVHEPGYRCPHEDCSPAPAGHVQMHDYLEHQRSAEQVAEYREKKSRAGKKGAESRARAKASTSTGASTGVEDVPEQQVNKTGTSTETEADTSLRSVGRSRGTRLPDDFSIDDEMRGFARSLGFGDERADAITAAFIDYWRGRAGAGGVKLDWPATWRNWIRKEAERNPRPVGAAAGTGGLRPWEL